MILVDADACPVREEAVRVAIRHGVPIRLVCDGGIRPHAHPLVEVVYVAQGLDAADRWIAEAAGPGDVVVTSDMPLASACVGRGARVVRHDGSALTPANIGAALATRDLMTELRAADPLAQGAGRGGGRPFSKADRARFSDALDRMVRAARSDGAAKEG